MPRALYNLARRYTALLGRRASALRDLMCLQYHFGLLFLYAYGDWGDSRGTQGDADGDVAGIALPHEATATDRRQAIRGIVDPKAASDYSKITTQSRFAGPIIVN